SCSAWGLPCRRPLPEPRCALTAPFHPYPPGTLHPGRAVLFSVALSVKLGFSKSPRPLAGMLPYGDRTFLPALCCKRRGGCPSGRPALIMGNRAGKGKSPSEDNVFCN